ncbi:MAG: class I tRNA ligase family protein [Agrococcus casei]|uniref:class I tRNA ligase family protein n=1 Tax=Agrococcus casei TaxID=343512 RepID=UPI003F9B15E5
MKTWNPAPVPTLPGHAERPRIFDDSRLEKVQLPAGGDRASLYSCGITPYDATHIGHAFTYLVADTLQRVWRDAGLEVVTAMNSTDVDDPLLERAKRDGVDWRELAASQHELFRDDMSALRILSPDSWVAVTDHIQPAAEAVAKLLETGAAYRLDGDVYFDSRASDELGALSQTDRETMLALSAERGGDPDRAGKRDPLDPKLWHGPVDGEPSWSTVLGEGRPGWHIECTVIARDTLGLPFTATLGGIDLKFPHQEFQAQHAHALGQPFSDARLCAGAVAYEGAKMSKSLGNLVKVSELLSDGVDPAAIRLALLGHAWHEDWEWTDAELVDAQERLARWREWARLAPSNEGYTDGDTVMDWLRVTLGDDLNTPAAIQAVDHAVASFRADSLAVDAIDALLGIDLR